MSSATQRGDEGGRSMLLEFDDNVFAQNYDQRPFAFTHRLVGHPLLEWPALVALAKRLPRKEVLHRHGRVPIDTNFDHSHELHANQLSLEETLERIEEVQGYVVLNTPELDPQFRPLVEEVLREIKTHSEPIDPGLYWHATYLFLSAGGSVTPYHMDRELNFLMQLRGTKEVQLWEPSVMSERERELLMTRWTAPRPSWRESHEKTVMRYPLGPGKGVHHPFIAPHLVKNGPELSVSFAVTFRTSGTDRKTNVYKLNHYLRKVGLDPAPPDVSLTVDRIKARTYASLVATAAVARPLIELGGSSLRKFTAQRGA